MTISQYERENLYKSTVVFKSGSTAINCSGNMAYLTVYKSDGTTLLGPVSGVHTSTGTYHYYVNTQSTDPLGIYVMEWMGRFNYQGRFGWTSKYDREPVEITYVNRS